MTRGKRKAANPPPPPSPPSSPDHDEEVPLFDATKFTSTENEEWYLIRTQTKVLIEKDISPEVEDTFHLTELFRTLHWENAFALPPYYYEELVREFYTNVENKKKPTAGLWSYVRGEKVGISSEEINEALDTPTRGLPVMFKKNFIPPEGTDWKITEATYRFGVIYTPSRQSNTMIISTSSFTAKHRLVLYFLGTNILPRASGTNEVRTSDIYFLDKMVNGLGIIPGINYGSVIINHMRDFLRNIIPKHVFPYPLLISLLLEKLDVDTSTATRTPVKASDKLRRATCVKMGIDLDRSDDSSPPPTTEDEAETSRPPRASRTPSILWRILASQETILAELEKVNKRLDESDARFARLEAHLGARPPSPPPYAPFSIFSFDG
ncbi:hypothetical protein OROHE_000228 [Orobanche hederae]